MGEKSKSCKIPFVGNSPRACNPRRYFFSLSFLYNETTLVETDLSSYIASPWTLATGGYIKHFSGKLGYIKAENLVAPSEAGMYLFGSLPSGFRPKYVTGAPTTDSERTRTYQIYLQQNGSAAIVTIGWTSWYKPNIAYGFDLWYISN